MVERAQQLPIEDGILEEDFHLSLPPRTAAIENLLQMSGGNRSYVTQFRAKREIGIIWANMGDSGQ